jgi:hypothetical protein
LQELFKEKKIMSIIEKLTEGIVSRNVQKEGQALLNKWEKTGLLEGLDGEHRRGNMAALLENQAKELLREASTMAAGDVEGFAAVAFPIVRRVFGGLIANEIVSVQPMSLPSGLIFFLDFTVDAGSARLAWQADESIYGGGRVASQITGGVNLGANDLQRLDESFYGLNNGFASPTGSATVTFSLVASGTFGGTGTLASTVNKITVDNSLTQVQFDRLLRHDPAFISGTSMACVIAINTASTVLNSTNPYNVADLVAISGTMGGTGSVLVRHLSQYSGTDGGMYDPGNDSLDSAGILMVVAYRNPSSGQTVDTLREGIDAGFFATAKAGINGMPADTTNYTVAYPKKDNIVAGGAVGGVVGTANWGLENNVQIPEINIQVDSVAITANTKKLKAKWTPELQQDINAYHNMDAEVELTGILSEMIALEIDQEILEDLVKLSTAGTYYWSRKPGKFVGRTSGGTINTSLFPDFTGTVSEWYETLLETVNDVSAAIHRKTLRGGANFLVCGPEVANILEFTSGFRADTTADENRGTAGAVKVGAISKKWDVYVDPYFPRNVILVGRKGNSFLESGYVYAPYVPLQVTPTIFGVEDFVPRKGVMTRYGKKMVRPDMYGLVIVEDLLGN